MISFNSPLGPTIETARLYLRPPVPEDFPGFCEFHRDPITMKHLGGVVADSVTWRIMRTGAGAWALDGFFMFSVLCKQTHEWIGRVGPLYPHHWPDREVGWGLISRFMGKGYALEAAIASMDYAFEQLHWDKVVHSISPENFESQRLAQRLGSVKLGPGALPDPHASVPIELWGQTRQQWRESNRLASVAYLK
ncbi:MAG: GNAT family N-acetyltransferase [Pirellulaceae bacterium]|nr:GNAT family N-acetyltransferase [Pirellulaceae bacterium]